MKTYGEVDVTFHAFLNSALDYGECAGSGCGRFTLGERTRRCPLNRRLGGRGGEQKIPTPVGS